MRASEQVLGPEEDRLAVVGMDPGEEGDRHRLSVDGEDLVLQLDDVAGEADEPLDEGDAPAVGVPDDDDVAPLAAFRSKRA